MIQQTIEKLHTLRLGAMADALRDQAGQPAVANYPSRNAWRSSSICSIPPCSPQRLQRLKRAGMRQRACIENLDLRTPRNLDRGTIAALASGQWIRQNLNILILGPAGIGRVGSPARSATAPPGTASRGLQTALAPPRRVGGRPVARAPGAGTDHPGQDTGPHPGRLAHDQADRRTAARSDGGDRRSARPGFDDHRHSITRRSLARHDRRSHIRRRDPRSAGAQRLSPRNHRQDHAHPHPHRAATISRLRNQRRSPRTDKIAAPTKAFPSFRLRFAPGGPQSPSHPRRSAPAPRRCAAGAGPSRGLRGQTARCLLLLQTDTNRIHSRKCGLSANSLLTT